MPIDIQSLLATLQARPGGVASGGRTMPMQAIQERVGNMLGQQGPAPDGPDLAGLQGMPDPRGMIGALSRGANMYPGGGPAQQGGGQQFGAPVEGVPGQGMEQGLGNGLDALLPPRNAVLRRIQAQRGNHGLLA